MGTCLFTDCKRETQVKGTYRVLERERERVGWGKRDETHKTKQNKGCRDKTRNTRSVSFSQSNEGETDIPPPV